MRLQRIGAEADLSEEQPRADIRGSRGGRNLTPCGSSESPLQPKIRLRKLVLMGPKLTFITLKKGTLLGSRDSAQSCISMGEAAETFYNIEVTPCRLLNEMENLLLTQ